MKDVKEYVRTKNVIDFYKKIFSGKYLKQFYGENLETEFDIEEIAYKNTKNKMENVKQTFISIPIGISSLVYSRFTIELIDNIKNRVTISKMEIGLLLNVNDPDEEPDYKALEDIYTNIQKKLDIPEFNDAINMLKNSERTSKISILNLQIELINLIYIISINKEARKCFIAKKNKKLYANSLIDEKAIVKSHYSRSRQVVFKEDEEHILTLAQYERLETEINTLSIKITEAVEELKSIKSKNASSSEDQFDDGMTEMALKCSMLNETLKNYMQIFKISKVIDEQSINSNQIEIGTIFEVLSNQRELQIYLLVHRTLPHDFEHLPVVSMQTEFGKAIFGKKEGDSFIVKVGNNETSYAITKIIRDPKEKILIKK